MGFFYHDRMAKDLSSHQRKIVQRYYEHQDTIRSQRLADLVTDIYLAETESKRTKLWGQAQIALMKAGVDAGRAADIAARRDGEALASLAAQIDAGKAPAAVAPTPVASAVPAAAQPSSTAALDDETLKRALHAFKRKLKTMRRDDESQLRGRYVTRGQPSNIAAITPPREFPPAVWPELARQGKLKAAGQGTYQLP